jgi:hypothetical protein
VFARAADGSLFAEGVTAADGTFHFAGLDGGSVTAAFEEDDLGDISIVSFVGVELDDELTFGGARMPAGIGVETTGTITVTWPANAAATSFRVINSCGTFETAAAGTTSATSDLNANCPASTLDILVVANDASGLPIASTFADDVAYTSGGTIDLPAFVAAQSFAWTATDIPGDVTGVQFLASALVGDTRGGGVLQAATPVAGAASVTIPMPVGVDGYMVSAGGGRGGSAFQDHVYRIDGSSLAQTFDGDDLLPWVTGIGYDRVDRRVSWTLDGVHAFDAHVVTIRWPAPAALYGGGPPTFYMWRVFAPPGAAEVTLPELPAALAAYEPPMTSVLEIEVYVYDLDGVDGYAGARAFAEPVYVCSQCAPIDDAWPGHGVSLDRATIGVAK